MQALITDAGPSEGVFSLWLRRKRPSETQHDGIVLFNYFSNI